MQSPYLEVSGRLLLTADAIVPCDDGTSYAGKYGILTDDLKKLWDSGRGVEIAQLYELVVQGLILSRHIFKGLRRRLYADDDSHADKSVLIYARVPAFDVTITRDDDRFPCPLRVPLRLGKHL